ncbi:hypothetical protein SAMN05444411_1127 [Lutibacter oricola]|uniref:Addiction module component n=1 Tax=Lutibacter oricola TaxID=762486 RepID=A0A1H3FNK8_9FLAO|nr:hypothetical protein [Lutibacter oricola]SDX92531.1 hypothetical protein SAMN05444411_1127 [Lutibacter oricola]
MNLEARKLSFIQEILKIQNEKTISRLETILRKEKTVFEIDDIQPMTMKKFNQRIDKSLEDSKQGKLTEINELISEIDKWN